MYQQILESLNDVVYLINEEGEIVYTNQTEIPLNLTKIDDNIYQKDDKSYYKTEQVITLDNKKYKLYQYKECTELYQTIIDQRTDSTTGLATRLVVDSYLNQLENNKSNGVIAMIDIDYFKSINDVYGHPFGDKILAQLALILQSSIGENDFVGRYGGEEFVVILNSKNLVNSLIQLDQIRKKVEHYFQNPNYNITISIGAAGFSEEDSISKKLKEADWALYHVKESGRNNVAFLNNYSDEYVVIHAPKQTNSIRNR